MSNAIEVKVKIVKRLSGGGAVFHDLGNFCFSFIVENKKQAGNYELFLNPVGGQAVLGRQFHHTTPWLLEQHG